MMKLPPAVAVNEGNSMITRRIILAIAAIGGLMGAAAAPAAAQSYPDRPIKLIVPFAPGDPMDTMARFIGQQTRNSSLSSRCAARRSGTAGGGSPGRPA